jgi:hypothetical protein
MAEIIDNPHTPYYMVSSEKELTYGDIYEMVQHNVGMGGSTPLYQLVNGYFLYANDAWSILTAAQLNGTVSDNADLTDENPGGRQNLSGYYFVTFELVTSAGTYNEETILTAPYFARGFYLIDSAKVSHVGPGMAQYKIVPGRDPSTCGVNITLPGEMVNYNGGITSEDFFRKSVLGLDGKDAENFAIQVRTVTPAELKTITDLSDYDMIYIGCGSSRLGMSDYFWTDYSKDNDIDQDTVFRVMKYVTDENVPVIVDAFSVYRLNNIGTASASLGYRTNDQAPYLSWLVAMLMSPNKSSFISGTGTLTGTVDYYQTFANRYTAADLGKTLESDTPANWTLSYVTEFSYVFYGETDRFVKSTVNGTEAYSETVINNGYGDVLAEIKLENMYRDADVTFDREKRLVEEVTHANSIRYILNYKNRRVSLNKSVLNVLELQPATTASSLSRAIVCGWMGMTNDTIDQWPQVNITCMPMNEYIGKIEDINATYDIVYIGSSTGMLPVSGSTTNYNDNTMDGLLYSHVGDRITSTYQITGLLDTDYTYTNSGAIQYVKSTSDYRYSGNDLTVEKYNALLEYMKASYPVVIDSGLVNNGAIRTDRIDNSSYLYELLNKYYVTTATKMPNVFSTSDLTSSNKDKQTSFSFYTNRQKLTMTGPDSNNPDKIIMTTEMYTNASVSAAQATVTQIAKSGDGYYLQFRFTLSNTGATSYSQKYVAKVYLDANADGKFSIEENLGGITVTDANGNEVAFNQLMTGQTYTVTRKIPENYAGCITWQLSVQQDNNEYIRVAKQGYTKLKGSEQTVIKILQVYMHTYDGYVNNDTNNTTVLEKQIGKLNANKTAYTGGSTGTNFYRLATQIIEDYALDIKSVRLRDFNSNLDSNSNYYNIDDYDMLILGFSDARNYGDLNTASYQWIQKFIESGKSVLFSHDLTSRICVEYNTYGTANAGRSKWRVQGTTNSYTSTGGGADPSWGYYMNVYLRSLVGLDEYGVTLKNLYNGSSTYASYMAGLRSGTGFTRNSAGQLVNNSDATQVLPESTMDANGFYNYNAKDVAYAPKSGRTSTLAETQALNIYELYDKRNGNQASYRRSATTGGTPHTSSASRINDGQITNYPFVIGNSITIADNHSQYFTLDMYGDSDEDGQADIVVWYTLSGGGFDNQPYDVLNNYYIYNKGNITYTGMGHSAPSVTVDEAQLFLNTMVAAYNAGKKTPSVVTRDEKGRVTTAYYRLVDSTFTTEVDGVEKPLVISDQGTDVDVYFSIEDLNLYAGTHTAEVKFYSLNPIAGATKIPAGTVYTDTKGNALNYKFDVDVYDVTNLLKNKVSVRGGGSVSDLTKMNESLIYRVQVPVEYFGKHPDNDYEQCFYVAVQTTITSTTTTLVRITDWGSSSVSYMDVNLFDLD